MSEPLRAGEEHDVLALLADEHDERSHQQLRSHMVWAPCVGCGSQTLVIPAHRADAACGPCLWARIPEHERTGAVMSTRVYGDTLQRRTATCVGGFDAAEHARDGSEVSFPSPKSTLSPVLPGAVLSLAEKARAAGWEVRTAGSTGHMPHARTGRPGALKELVSLRFGEHPMTARRAYAVYSRTASGGTWGWSSVMAWGPTLLPFAGFGIADLRRYLFEVSASDEAVLAWVRDARRAAAAKKAEVAARPRRALKPKEGMS